MSVEVIFVYFIVPCGSPCLWESECFFCFIVCDNMMPMMYVRSSGGEDANASAHSFTWYFTACKI